MAYNGSGVFSRLYNWVNDKNNGIKILASRMDAEMDGFASGLSNVICKDGQSTPTGNIPMGGFKLTGLGAGTNAADAVTASQIQSGLLNYYADTGAADAYVITPSPVVKGYVAGQAWKVKIAHTNLTTAPVLNVNGLGNKNILLRDGVTPMPIGGMIAGAIMTLDYDGTQFLASSVAQVAPVTDATITTTDVTTNNASSAKHGWQPKSPADATKFLNGAATPGYANVKDSDLALTDITTNNVSASAHGFMPKFPNNTTTYLRGDGTYVTLPISPIKAWVNFVGSSGSINASSNVSSVTRNGTGDYTVNFTSNMTDANYNPHVNCINGTTNNQFIGNVKNGTTNTQSATRISVWNANANAAADGTNVFVTIVGN